MVTTATTNIGSSEDDVINGSFLPKKKSCLDYGCKQTMSCIPVIDDKSRMTVHKCIGNYINTLLKEINES